MRHVIVKLKETSRVFRIFFGRLGRESFVFLGHKQKVGEPAQDELGPLVNFILGSIHHSLMEQWKASLCSVGNAMWAHYFVLFCVQQLGFFLAF